MVRHKGRQPPPLAERFWEKVDKRGPNECWLWRGAIGRHGYGNLGSGTGRTLRAHRFSYELAHGAIPNGLVICHRCDEPRCVNPTHLFAASQSSNLQDMANKGRSTRGERSPAAKLDGEAVLTIRTTNIAQGKRASNYVLAPVIDL